MNEDDFPRRSGAAAWLVAGLVLLLLTTLFLMSTVTENSTRFGNLYSLILIVNLLGVSALLLLIAGNLRRLVRQYRQRMVGSRLTSKLVVTFTILAVVPVSIVYAFSLQFLHRSIDSWFDVRIEQALTDALDLSRSSLETRMRELLRETEQLTSELTLEGGSLAALAVDDLRERASASELTLIARNGSIITTSSADPTQQLVPNQPGDTVLLQVLQGHTYVGLDPIGDSGLHIRVVVNVPDHEGGPETFFVQALYPVPERQSALADSVQDAFGQYRELAFLRTPLKYSFTLTLSLVLLLSMLAAVWGAFFAARQLVAPITHLAEGTQAVAAGDYGKQIPPAGYGEMGILVRSFNDMTRRIAQSRDQARRSQRQVENQRAYLEAVLASLSSGVFTLDRSHILRTGNRAASQILGTDLKGSLGHPFTELCRDAPNLDQFVQAILPRLRRDNRDWREEVTLFDSGGRKVLMCRGSALPGSGFVVVFDDITNLIQAQRNAAWGEVARRLAHEIKNPLTPIQLSAERLRHKYLGRMEGKDAELLDRLTHTIVQQVEGMKEMVNAFSSYARAPAIQPKPLDLNQIVSQVVEMYRSPHLRLSIVTELADGLPLVNADGDRLRQVLHNLLKNADEAAVEDETLVRVVTRFQEEREQCCAELLVEDTGPGIPEEIVSQLFEPYVTTKPKGTGLGLAIVKKIIEEHQGMIWAENLAGGGTRFGIRLPVSATRTTTTDPAATSVS